MSWNATVSTEKNEVSFVGEFGMYQNPEIIKELITVAYPVYAREVGFFQDETNESGTVKIVYTDSDIRVLVAN